jgi:hypothetical protein
MHGRHARFQHLGPSDQPFARTCWDALLNHPRSGTRGAVARLTDRERGAAMTDDQPAASALDDEPREQTFRTLMCARSARTRVVRAAARDTAP